MNKGWLWFLGGAFLVLILGWGVRLIGFARFFGRALPYRTFPHTSIWGVFPFGWMMLGMWLIPLLVVVLLVLGIIALIRSSSNSSANNKVQTAPKTCPSCGKTVQPDWKNCPYCGAKLEE
ncbi:MAG: zinc ribbon domain-containing protein [Anaerolineales bacterium]